jgi:uncharacterized protein
MKSDQTRAFLEDVFHRCNTSRDMRVWLDALADDLVWKVTGSTPTSGVYRSKQAYIDGVVTRLKQWVQEEPVPILKKLVVEQDEAAAWLQAEARSKDGTPFTVG